MAKRTQKKAPREPINFGGLIDDSALKAPEGTAEPSPNPQTAPARRVYPGIHRTSVYIPEEVHQVMRRVAFDMNCKEHDLIIEGLELLLTTKHGMPPFKDLKKG